MGTKHKHYDVIVAWAAGEEIEFFDGGFWYPLSTVPDWSSSQYRIKPKRVKKEGWVNVYRNDVTMHDTKEKSDECACALRVACIRIEWEEDA